MPETGALPLGHIPIVIQFFQSSIFFNLYREIIPDLVTFDQVFIQEIAPAQRCAGACIIRSLGGEREMRSRLELVENTIDISVQRSMPDDPQVLSPTID